MCEAEGAARWAFNFGVWQPSEAEWSDCLSLIEPEEVARIGRFRRPISGKWVTGRENPDAKSALVGRLLLREAVHSLLGLPYGTFSLKRTQQGKPYVDVADQRKSTKGFPCFNLNVSHHGDFVVLVAEPHDLVGVDVMKTELRATTTAPEFLEGMRHTLTSHEWAQVDGDLDAFFTMWCLKESLIKAMGIGLGFDLQRASFTFRPGKNDTVKSRPQMATVELDGRVPKSQWVFEVFSLDRLHMAAVCTTAPCETHDGFRCALLTPNDATKTSPPRGPFRFLTIADLTKTQ